MSWDIYGEPLRRGHCEVHPHVHEEYPCSVCIADKQANDQQGMCKGGCESEHLLGLAREHIEHLEQERDALAENWGEVAAQYARNADFYQGIVRRIGDLFGEEVRMSDDGSFQDDVLALKVRELVEALQVERDTLAAHVRSKDEDPK